MTSAAMPRPRVGARPAAAAARAAGSRLLGVDSVAAGLSTSLGTFAAEADLRPQSLSDATDVGTPAC